MQYIDNDMDELFNKAGRDYPLNTDPKDWDAVFRKLQQPDPAVIPVNGKGTNSRRWLWLLLLLLLPFGFYLGGSRTENRAAGQPAAGKTSTTGLAPQEAAAGSSNEKNAGSYKASAAIATTTGTTAASRRPSLSLATPQKVHYLPSGIQHAGYPEDGSVDADEAISPILKSGFPRSIPYELHVKDIPAMVLAPRPAAAARPARQTGRAYIGLLAGPDLSTIRYQQINHIGFSVGVMAGYRAGRRWGIEAGLLYNRKKYYTDGEYFDKSRSNIPARVTVNYLDGGCEMFELPVSLRYDLTARKNNRFFVTAGATSYFMKKETYDYEADAGGTLYKGHRSYDNSGNHFFSNVQFSAGYQRHLWNRISFRVEPYIKIPVKNIGIGNLPVTSTGIYFGLQRSIR